MQQKCRELKNLPAKKIQYLQDCRNRSLNASIAVLKKASDMLLVNDISDAQYGVADITQLLPSGSVITWRRSLEPSEPVHQGTLKNEVVTPLRCSV